MKYVKGNLLTATTGLIVHGVNCQAVMGSGVALAIKSKYPKVYSEYLLFCDKHSIEHLLGMINYVDVTSTLCIANAFTQHYYGRNSNRQYVSYDAIEYIAAQLAHINVPIHMPKIGAGLGGGDWGTIEAILSKTLANNDVTIYEL